MKTMKRMMLGAAIGCGLAAAGTLIPPIAQGHAGDLVKDAAALTVLGGVVGSLLGIVFVGLAGKAKENEMPEEAKRKAVAEFDFKKGLDAQRRMSRRDGRLASSGSCSSSGSRRASRSCRRRCVTSPLR